MTFNGGRLTLKVTRVSFSQPEPPDVATSMLDSEINHVPV